MKKPVRVAHIIGKWVGGGVETVIMNYDKNINHDKVQFDFICDNDSTNIPYEEIESLGGKVILIPPYQKPLSYHRNLKKILKEEKYQIVHSHINTMSVFPLFAAKRAGVSVRIAHSHSTTNKKEIGKNLMKQVLRPLAKIFATHYFCCSEHAGCWLFGNKTYKKGKVYLLNNAIDLQKFKYNKETRETIRKELNINEDTLVIGHIGRFMKQKNHSYLIDIFNEVHNENSNSILVLVGQGPLQEKIKEKVKKLNLEKEVIFLGQRSDADKLYQAFDVFVLPSLYEGLGMVAIEAQASGLSCIFSTRVPKEANVVKELVKFLDISRENIKEWKEEILHINKERKKDVSMLLEKYEIKREAKRLEEKYNSLIGELR